jgi:hypothetical protein
MIASVLRGALGFAVVGVASFSVWAMGGKVFAPLGGEKAMYAGCTLVFLLLSGALLYPLVQGGARWRRFNQAFLPAFFAYALLWSVLWFAYGFGAGEWAASALGSLVFVSVCALVLGGWRALPLATMVLFMTHSAGYFLGGELYYPSDRTMLMKCVWGLCYGLGFGAGIGYVFWALQRAAQRKL